MQSNRHHRSALGIVTILVLSVIAVLGRAESAQAVVCFTPGWSSGGCTSSSWLGGSGGTEGWKHTNPTLFHTGSVARMYNNNCSTCARTMGIWFLAPGQSVPTKVDAPSPTLDTWTVHHTSGAYRRLCINLGGSGGNFACDWDT